MKKLKWWLAAVMVMVAVVARADIFDDIAQFIRTGNAHEVARYFGSSVELKTLDQSNVYSRNQAEMVLKDFFEKNPPRGFTIIHRGASAKGARFCIGNLETTKGTFRTNLYIKDVGGTLTIQELSIEQQ